MVEMFKQNQENYSKTIIDLKLIFKLIITTMSLVHVK